MGFSTKQVQALRRQLDRRHVRTREANGREISYVEGWYAISEANRIFGFDGWNRETVESRCVLARENRGAFLAVYVARVRVTVHADGVVIVREGHGTAEGRGTSPGEVHDVALKAAETDATKRALATFGRPFGLELYRNKAPVSEAALPSSPQTFDAASRLGFHPDDTTPIPRPSRYYGRRQNSLVQHLRQENHRAETQPTLPGAPALVPGQIDKSVLTIAEPRRLRDKAHLKFVASQPCLVCGRQPSDPHHLRFAQPRALALKVSDEFTVPLCRGHHRQLHQAGNEVTWWDGLSIDALEIAKGLWEHTRPKAVPSRQWRRDRPHPPELTTTRVIFKMSSLKQIVANRRNALKSTGPTTPEGKQHARCNAVRHGLTAETVIGVLEDANDYAAFEAAVTADYDAESAVERELVLRLASVLWRLRRATGIETALFDSVTSHKFSLRAHGSYRDVLESERETLSGDDQRCIQKDIAESFLRLAEEPSRPIALLTRYEDALWRQARQIVFALRSFRRNRRAMRRGVLTQTPYPLYPRRRTFIT